MKHFAWDLPASEARVLAATQGPISASAFGAQVTGFSWKITHAANRHRGVGHSRTTPATPPGMRGERRAVQKVEVPEIRSLSNYGFP